MKNWFSLLFILPFISFGQDIEAAYPGGASAILNYVKENIRNPLTDNDEGCKVYVSFVVETDGSVAVVKVERSCSAELDAEAVRLLKNMPLWRPGQTNGVPVRTRCRMPINFLPPSRKEAIK